MLHMKNAEALKDHSCLEDGCFYSIHDKPNAPLRIRLADQLDHLRCELARIEREDRAKEIELAKRRGLAVEVYSGRSVRVPELNNWSEDD